jgi:hypothetical protein
MTAINERLHLKGTSTRPSMDGWVDKGGAFSMGVSTPVIGKLHRTTYLRAKVSRESGVTTISGDVPGGANRQGQMLVFAALGLVALVLAGGGNPLLGLVIIPFAAILYIPMKGDYENSELLIGEVQKVLKAKTTQPKAAKAHSRPTAPKATSSARPMPAALADADEEEDELEKEAEDV